MLWDYEQIHLTWGIEKRKKNFGLKELQEYRGAIPSTLPNGREVMERSFWIGGA